MITENILTFKDLEKKFFKEVCQLAQKYTKELLEEYARELMNSRDKKKYRHKGLKKTTIKTIYGEVTYERVIYEIQGNRH